MSGERGAGPQRNPKEALEHARILAKFGVPLFTSRLKPNGDPLPPSGWEKTRPSAVVANRFRPSRQNALCAVSGVEFDVIDVDPRNGGDKSIKRLSDELGENGPEVYWRVKTPSGGVHLYIACLGIGSHPGFLPGLDLKGGKPDGSSRGFTFLPPTVRPSKVTGELAGYCSVNGGPEAREPIRCDALAEFVENRASALAKDDALTGTVLPRDEDALEQACLDAEAGSQRAALLRYVHEQERLGLSERKIVRLTLALTREMPCYDKRRPWTERDIRGLLHRDGAVIPDAQPGELDGIGEVALRTSGLIQWASSLQSERISWLWPGYLAFRELTVLDGEKGQGKSFVVDDWAARASTGRPMPGRSKARDPIKVIIFTDEGHMESTTLPRLIAAGADVTQIALPRLRPPKRGKEGKEWELALPDGAAVMERMIQEAGAQLAIWDPITDFLAEDIQTHNDASVRRALRPLNLVLNRTHCAGLAIRHMNKDTKQVAKFRGSGSSAFQNRARVHLIAARVPASFGGEGAFAISQVDVNIAKGEKRALTYSIVDSDVIADDEEEEEQGYVGITEWHGYADISPNALTQREKQRPGPSADRRSEVEEVLQEMFSTQTTWDVDDAKRQLKEAGVSTAHVTIDAARKQLGIAARAVFRPGGGVERWVWTTEPRKEKVRKRGKVEQ